jgi:SAM-dependent methyltransferase
MIPTPLYESLESICTRPALYSVRTARELWTDAHISGKMLEYHLNPDSDLASRKPEFIDKSVDWMKAHFRIGPGSRIVDFGCGPGLYTNRLARTGARVTGIDFSANSLAYARKKAAEDGLVIDYVEADYLEYEGAPESCDLISLIYCDICPLNPEQRARLLGLFRRMLAPGGRVLLDVWTTRYYESRKEETEFAPRQMDGFWSKDDYFGFHCAFKYDKEKVVLDKYAIAESGRTRSYFNWLQCYTPATLAEEMRTAGLHVSEIYGDVAGAPFRDDSPLLAVVATKV